MDPFIGEIRLFTFANSRVPSGWHLCDGALLTIAQYTPLFALIGTIYGGNGTTNFALPDLRGRVPVGIGQGAGLSPYTLTQMTGVESVTLNATQMPTHNHLIKVNNTAGNTANPQNGYIAEPNNGARPPATSPAYTTVPIDGATLAADAVTITGGNQPHSNIQPVLGLMYCIAVQGIFPSFD